MTYWMVAYSVYLYIVIFGVNVRICRGQRRNVLSCRISGGLGETSSLPGGMVAWCCGGGRSQERLCGIGLRARQRSRAWSRRCRRRKGRSGAGRPGPPANWRVQRRAGRRTPSPARATARQRPGLRPAWLRGMHVWVWRAAGQRAEACGSAPSGRAAAASSNSPWPRDDLDAVVETNLSRSRRQQRNVPGQREFTLIMRCAVTHPGPNL